MSLESIVHRPAFLLMHNLIIQHYYSYVNAFTLVHLSVFEFASIDLTLVRLIQKKDIEVPENYVFLLVLINVNLKDITLSRLCYYLSESTRGTNTKLCFVHHI